MIFQLALFVLWALVAQQIYVADRDEILTMKQMTSPTRSPYWLSSEGLPFWEHWGMRSDIFAFSPLLALIIVLYYREWSMGLIMVAGFVGLIGSIPMHLTWKKIPWRETHVTGDGHLTDAVWGHIPYMAIAIGVLWLYFIDAKYTPWMWVVAFLVTAHVVLGTHAVLVWRSPWWYPGRSYDWGAMFGVATATFGVTVLRAMRVW